MKSSRPDLGAPAEPPAIYLNSRGSIDPLPRLRSRLMDSLSNFTKATQLPAELVEASDRKSPPVTEEQICKKELSISNSALRCFMWHSTIRQSAEKTDLGCGKICHMGMFLISYPFKIKTSVLLYVEVGPVALAKQSLCEAAFEMLKPSLIALQEEFNSQVDIALNTLPPAVKKVCEYVRANIRAPISSETLASITSLSPGHFARIFRRSMGMSIANYISQERVNVASQRLLKDRHLRISEIALESGFESIPHFNREFRRHKGTSPTTFKKIAPRSFEN